MRAKAVLIIAFIFTMVTVYPKTQSDRLRPQWVTKQVPEAQSGSYIFVQAQGSGGSLDAARQSAVANLTTRLECERGLKINSKLQTQSRMVTDTKYTEATGAHSSYQYRQTDDISMEVVENGEPIKIICRTIDEYWICDHGVYTIDILYTVADKNMYGGSYDNKITTTTKYPAAGFISIVPGAGQMYKGDFLKGGLFMGAGILGATGIVLCESNRAAYSAKVTQQPKYAQQYSTKANNWCLGRDICIGVTAGVWVWNVIDAFVAKGARRVNVQQNNRLSFISEPQYDPIWHSYDPSVGVALKL